jgi:DNA mismatch repair protein MutS
MVEMMPAQQAPSLSRYYEQIKAQYPDTILLFRVGWCFEAYRDDAYEVSAILKTELKMLERGALVPTTVFPGADEIAEQEIGKLIAAGHKVAICERIGG